ncbi:hypothetical protein QZH56_36760 [Streptomyces olivoreticuli]|uniref:hypothetical protein n=1 Tax=Streptomyces olivoreticuli TaxID=68246 RepID=UPI0026581BBD|nr:hypothetical protein [Streptomyces olivoreticuli]WKK24130.1 hypothetical protein QZH56_36760 [Streptomyces olivoreticuli]
MLKAVPRPWSGRTLVLGILAATTLGVAVLSMAVSYQILNPRFGVWASPTVGALDTLWVVLQATEILAANNRRRVRRVQWAGLVLTAVIAAIPTADLIVTPGGGVDLAVVLAPVAIVATKSAWWLVLPSLGRRVSPITRQAIDIRRQEVADRLEQMEADAADRIELLTVATDLEQRVGEAETAYRLSTLKAQQSMTEQLHKQAEATAGTIAQMPLPEAVRQIALPELEGWVPTAPALPVTSPGTGRHAPGTQVSALTETEEPRDVTSPGAAVTLADLAAVRGVPTPPPGEPLTDDQLGVVLRYLRYSEDPPRSYRQAVKVFRGSGFIGSEERVRRVWGQEVAVEDPESESEDPESEDVAGS